MKIESKYVIYSICKKWGTFEINVCNELPLNLSKEDNVYQDAIVKIKNGICYIQGKRIMKLGIFDKKPTKRSLVVSNFIIHQLFKQKRKDRVKMNILQKLKDKLYSKEVDKKNIEKISITEFQGLTIIGTAKEIYHLPLEIKSLAHNIYVRNADNTLRVAKMRDISTTYTTYDKFYWDKEGYGRVPQKDGKRRKNDLYAIWDK